jgi:choline transport protein
LVVLNYPDYDFHRWHGTLILWAVIVIGVTFNTVLARLLPWVEASILITHCLGFVVVVVPLVYFGPHGSAKDVFVQYLTLGNYSPGLSWFVGLITTVFGFLGRSMLFIGSVLAC